MERKVELGLGYEVKKASVERKEMRIHVNWKKGIGSKEERNGKQKVLPLFGVWL